ncbi:hypothetical protein DM860_002390 [Cuscuta australis]|uniref:L-gulonolactone oxidase n=1 Tax=Cuscuta australis TaxID=267555 RepID=A0A328CY86_9ASTE|nr:hypothetical protein DM860_002390 [Cuscuta australis]
MGYLVICAILMHIFFMIILSHVHSTPPNDPMKCTNHTTNINCTITNSYGTFPDRSICRAAKAAYPRTEEELVAVTAAATKENRKMKAATRFSSSITKLACPGGGGGDGLIISTMHLNRTLKVDNRSMTVTVESGVSLRQLINDAAEAGMALPYTPYWWGLTVGGMMATGAHGSSLWRSAGTAVHDFVVRVRIVTPASPEEGYATVRQLEEDDPEINAARVSLGVLGVISQVTLKLEPMFTRAMTYAEEDDGDLGEDAAVFGSQHEFGDMAWFPSQRRVVKRIDNRVETNAPSRGLNNFLGFRPIPSLVLGLVRTAEESMEALNYANGKCILADTSKFILKAAGYGFTNNGVIFTGYPIIGYQNRLQSSGTCLDSSYNELLTACPWDPRVKGLFFHQTTFSISLSKVKGFIEEVQDLVNLDPKALCGVGLYDGILMRYVTSSSAYLGKQDDSIDFDITYYRSKDPKTPRLYQDFLEEIEQLAIFKYKALPHWGKNRNVAFLGAIKKYTMFDEFLKVKDKYDPKELFSSDWTDQVLGLKKGLVIAKDGCSLEGLCICSQDSHCAPSKGYYCQPGKVYKDARVCALR